MSDTDLELQRALGRIEARLDEMHNDIRDLRDDQVKTSDKLDGRVGRLESQRNYAAGIFAALVFVYKAFVTK
jgi:predicted  nucleic acid-binding Zn-ribbon protein